MDINISTIFKIAKEDKLSCRQLALLWLIYKEELHTSTKKYAERLGIAKPAITRILDKLEVCGYVSRSFDSRDRRVNFVHGTQKGRDYFNTLLSNGNTLTE